VTPKHQAFFIAIQGCHSYCCCSFSKWPGSCSSKPFGQPIKTPEKCSVRGSGGILRFIALLWPAPPGGGDRRVGGARARARTAN
jgi:hypothetical protein